MNNSGNKNPGSSPGFVYFTTSPKNLNDTTNFLAFEESPKQNDQYSLPNYGTPKFHSSPSKFNLRNTYRYSGSSRGNRPYHSPNNSFNNSWNNQRSPRRNNQRSPRQHHHRKGQLFSTPPMMSADGKRDISMFYDHTCTWNPWFDLEKKLATERASEKVKEIQSIVDKKEADIDGTSKKEESSCSEDEESSSTNEESSNSDEESDTT